MKFSADTASDARAYRAARWRALLVALASVVAGAVLAAPAVAAQFGQETGAGAPAQEQRPGPGPQGGMQQGMPQRGMRGGDESERERMSPEQRRQLRRDIQDAGKDIYRPMRQGRGDGRRAERR